jgi:PIN domain nuclease of toxin-antitoxin system
VRLLLDSHIALWCLEGNPKLATSTQNVIAHADTVFISAVTPWELGIKRALGKLSFPDGLVAAFTAAGFEMLSISAMHSERAPELPPHHRDPFDRMLIAQAQSDDLVLVTADSHMHAYEVSLLSETGTVSTYIERSIV